MQCIQGSSAARNDGWRQRSSPSHLLFPLRLRPRRSVPQHRICAECDVLHERLRIVREKGEVFNEGLQLLRQARRDMESDRTVAGALAAAYTTLQGLNIAFGVATLPCSIPQGWLRGLIGGAAGLGAYVQEGDAGEVTLATVISSLGLGVVSDAISTYEFMQRYEKESVGLEALRSDLDRAIREFQAVRDDLRRERRSLESVMSRGDCPDTDTLERFLR